MDVVFCAGCGLRIYLPHGLSSTGPCPRCRPDLVPPVEFRPETAPSLDADSLPLAILLTDPIPARSRLATAAPNRLARSTRRLARRRAR